MQITDKQLDQFIALYKQEFGETLSRTDAHESFSSMLRLMTVSIEPLQLEEEIIDVN